MSENRGLIIQSDREKSVLFNLFNWNKEKIILKGYGQDTTQADRNIREYIQMADELKISFRLQNLFLNARDPKGEAADVMRDHNITINRAK